MIRFSSSIFRQVKGFKKYWIVCLLCSACTSQNALLVSGNYHRGVVRDTVARMKTANQQLVDSLATVHDRVVNLMRRNYDSTFRRMLAEQRLIDTQNKELKDSILNQQVVITKLELDLEDFQGTDDTQQTQIERYKQQLARMGAERTSLKAQLEEFKKELADLRAASSGEARIPDYGIVGNESRKTRNDRGLGFIHYKVNLRNSDIRFFWKSKDGGLYNNFDRYKQDMNDQQLNLVFATNGGMFNPQQEPQGLYIEEGQLIKDIDLNKKGYGNFYLQPNGVFLITKDNKPVVTTSDRFEPYRDNTRFATQSGPMLIIDGKINPKLGPQSPNFHIRNGVGVIDEETVVFIISEGKVRFYELAQQFQALGCQNALYLDGAISETYLPEMNMKSANGSFGVMIGVVKPESWITR